MPDDDLRKDSESSSESFGNVRKGSEAFGKLPKGSESFRKENHTLSVKDVLKLFESKSVGITERSIINYCHPNKYGVSLLDCFLDENERKYYITPESAEKAIEEVKARKIRLNQEQERLSEAFRKGSERPSESFGNVRKGSETPSESFGKAPNDSETNNEPDQKDQIKELEQKNLDLKITNRGKDYFIDQLKNERELLLTKVEDSARLIGKLETELRQIEAPKETRIENENPANITDIEGVETSTKGQENENIDVSENPKDEDGHTEPNYAPQTEEHNI